MRRHSRAPGFTLMEISIVIVIIGLVIVGFVGGGEMIHAAKIRKTVSQIQQIKTNMQGFKLKYGRYPGDFNKASQFWPGDSPVDGDGDGKITEYDSGDAVPMYETQNIFHHMSLAQMVWGSGWAPVSAMPLAAGVHPMLRLELEQSQATVLYYKPWTTLQTAYANWFFIAGTNSDNPRHSGDLIGALLGNYANLETVPIGILPKDGYAIDAKTDDGKPLSGNTLTDSPNMGGDPKLSCAMTDGTDAYNVTAPYYNCTIITPIDAQ